MIQNLNKKSRTLEYNFKCSNPLDDLIKVINSLHHVRAGVSIFALLNFLCELKVEILSYKSRDFRQGLKDFLT